MLKSGASLALRNCHVIVIYHACRQFYGRRGVNLSNHYALHFVKLWLSYFILLLLLACRNEAPDEEVKWSNAVFDSNLSKTADFRSLYVPGKLYTLSDPWKKDTCGIAHTDNRTIGDSFQPDTYYTCHVNPDSGGLTINIGSNSLHGGIGFMANYAGKKFTTQHYRWIHNDNTGQTGSTYKILGQKLVLDKEQYKPGDSLFGKAYFHIMEEDKGEKKEYQQQAIFRAKVTIPEYTVVDGKRLIMMHPH